MKLSIINIALAGLVAFASGSALPNDGKADDLQSFDPSTAGISLPAGPCREGELKCMAKADNGMDGAVFICRKSQWDIFTDCASYEKCVDKPTPHCTWGFLGREAAVDVPKVTPEVPEISTVNIKREIDPFCLMCEDNEQHCLKSCGTRKGCRTHCRHLSCRETFSQPVDCQTRCAWEGCDV
ncbi:hypothetical protein ACN47E_004537 [Coniothyrium glycines]